MEPNRDTPPQADPPAQPPVTEVEMPDSQGRWVKLTLRDTRTFSVRYYDAQGKETTPPCP
jgi:hypothetical protein